MAGTCPTRGAICCTVTKGPVAASNPFTLAATPPIVTVTGLFNGAGGLYRVPGGALSPLRGMGPERLMISGLSLEASEAFGN